MTFIRTRLCFLSLMMLFGGGVAGAADLPPPAPLSQPVPSSAWTFRFTPYGWLTALNGNQTVKGRTVKVDASFIDIVDATLGEGGTLIALMGDLEARNGRFALFADVVWSKIGVDHSGARTRSAAPGIVGAVGAAADVKVSMGIIEAGAAYEVARFGSVSFDVLAGARYWYQRANLSFDLATTVDIGDLSFGRNVAIARSGTVDWLDGFAGARLRVAVAPGQELFLRGDIGGGGSKFSWQGIAAYGFDFAEKNGVTYSGVIGYRALYVDYSQGEGRRRYAFDMLQHGPVVGLSLRF
ncbi:hypothetical protein FQV39_17930 [Bosea sp. F3-2]|uniref:hypothetical protein n=1 Tax=Bosea sp. F3-2 TaxID=2599640 RepID=UPI0011EFDE42|nr:hypothetical protein [Bosea sp. F3-2]QEL24249.1 hypothetical protein FQV39_17930 [Bosea sp. F3-2]